jgi:hypothetical protein
VINISSPNNEEYCPLEITLNRTYYFTNSGVKRWLNINPSLAWKYKANPRRIRDSRLTHLISVSVFVICGKVPYLIIGKRTDNVDSYARCWTTMSGFCEINEDLEGAGTKLDFVRAMWRELGEEKAQLVNEKRFRDNLGLIGFYYIGDNLNYDLSGYIELPELDPDLAVSIIPQAKEIERFHKLRWPLSLADEEAWSGLRKHLSEEIWIPTHVAEIVELLHAKFGWESLKWFQ